MPHVYFLDHKVYFEPYLPTLILSSFSEVWSQSNCSERNSTLKLEAQPFFQACKCVCLCLQNYHPGEREDHSPRWHYLNRNCSAAQAWKPFRVQMYWQHILFKSLNSSLNLLVYYLPILTGIFEIVATPEKSALAWCVCAPCACLCCVRAGVYFGLARVSRKAPGLWLLSSYVTPSQPSYFTIILKLNAPATFNSELCLFACGLFYCKIKILRTLCFPPKSSMVVLKAK